MTKWKRLQLFCFCLFAAVGWTALVGWLFDLGPVGTCIALMIALYVTPAAVDEETIHNL